MTDNSIIRRGGNGPDRTQFGEHERRDGDNVALIGENANWVNGGQGDRVTVVESTVSDRDRNYWVQFEADGGYINVNPFEFGIEDPDFQSTSDGDRLYVGTENYRGENRLQVQFASADDPYESEYMGAVADLDDETVNDLENEILNRLRFNFGEDIDVQFASGGDRWDDIQVFYNKVYDDTTGGFENDRGKISFFTSNLMADLESDETYRSIRNGAGLGIVAEVLAENNLL